MLLKKSAVMAVGLMLLFKLAWPKSVWHKIDTGTQYFLTSVSAPDSLHVWVTGGILLHSIDGGRTWFTQFDPGPNAGLEIVTFVDSLHGWAFGGLCCFVPICYRTVDGGKNWTQLSCPTESSPSPKEIRAVSFIDTLNGWLAMDGDTVYCTRDGGLSWVPYFVGVSSFTPTQIQFVDTSSGWLAGNRFTGSAYAQVLHSSDGGENWAIQNLNLADTGSNVVDMDFIDVSTGWLLVAVAGKRIYRTTDGGATWTVTYGEVGGPIRKALDFVDGSKGWIAGTEFFGGFVSAISSSTDSGRSFVDTLIQEGSAVEEIKMFSEELGWAVDAIGGVLVYAPLILGDVNWDRGITPTDVVPELNRVFLGVPFPAPDIAGDVNCDGNFTPADVVWLLNRVFLFRPFPCN